MSFNRLYYDNCSYNQTLLESEGPGAYQLMTPATVSQMCLADDPHIRAQYMGSRHVPGTKLIDVDSELMNITRSATACPSGKYIPHSGSSTFCSAPNSHSMASTDTIPSSGRSGYTSLSEQERTTEGFKSGNHMSFSNCFTPTESTRLSNPPCTLRGTGINRWEWLCKNPQDRVEVPFDHMIDSVLMAKDNHRPLIPRPMDQTAALPVATDAPMCETLHAAPEVPTGSPSINWKQRAEYGY
jgi:hypothetical protein